MIIYKCIITNDEMFTDAYKMREIKNNLFYEVEGKYVTRTEDFDMAATGANPSAEEGAEATEGSSASGVDIVLNHRLVKTDFSKKDFKLFIKDYVKAIKGHLMNTNPERVKTFEASAIEGVKMILANFDEYTFYTGESMNPEGMVGLLDYREDGVTPYMLFFKDGLLVEKY
ncbi:translationally-controlled tumor protein homolog [Chelmon rostratus]|uniref:translationally-controlled tumor protein homolog n=1 Tax=Chelmon rostratus TaxID=109905 RepID=UPI001BE7E59B|nr:translationally-controlled tumor protein homolog [Chelmon rostratus]